MAYTGHATPSTRVGAPGGTWIEPQMLKVPCVLMRGGTSRGLVFRREHLPADPADWDLVFLAAIGSPDRRQLDGVGAGDSHTSKVAIVNRSADAEADIDYLFGEVAIDEPRVDYALNSGNIISALGLYAVEEGLVDLSEPETRVRVRNLNTSKSTILHVPVKDGRVADEGEFAIDGVPGYGPRIDMEFPNPQGAVTGRLLPTGSVRNRLELPDGGAPLDATLLDAANPVVLVSGAALGVSAEENVDQLNGDPALLGRLQAIRASASVAMGLVESESAAWQYSPMIPFLVLLYAPTGYPSYSDPDRVVAARDMDLCVRVVSLNRFHKSVNVTVSVALASAALLPGSLAQELRRGAGVDGELRIGHPSGIARTRARARLDAEGAVQAIESVRLGRTARRIMQGEVLVQPYKIRYLRELMRSRASARTPV